MIYMGLSLKKLHVDALLGLIDQAATGERLKMDHFYMLYLVTNS